MKIEPNDGEFSLDIKDLKLMHDSSFNNGVITRESAADDMVFYWVTQWDDISLAETELQYRGEFNIIRKAGRDIAADLRSNPVQLNFDAKDPEREDGADLIDGLYLSHERMNETQEAFNNADGEAIVCGVGAYEYYTEYESNLTGDEKQVIKCRPVYEANDNCFWDPNAKRLDKSDAMFCSILTMYSEEAFVDLVEDLTGKDRQEALGVMASFADPQQSYAFPWAAGKNEGIYVVTFYHRTKMTDHVVTLNDPMGQELVLLKSGLTEIEDDLIEDGFTFVNEKEIERWCVTKYIACGAEILSEDIIAGEFIPVVPVYGERAFIEGEEHYEGITRLAKDPQRLRNFQLSYLADIASRSPRPKPIFNSEQVQGFEFMYDKSGADNQYPYYIVNRLAVDGTPLAPGPAIMPEQQIPTALTTLIAETREAVSDVANSGLPDDIGDTELSGKAMEIMQGKFDRQSIVYQEHRKHARRRGGAIFASMATVVYDSPRAITITKPDGTRVKESIMEAVTDKDSGELVVLNDITNLEFDVYADIGPSYSSKRSQTIEQLEKMMINAAAMGDPAMSKMLMLKQMTLVDGVAFDDIRDYARKQLILDGVTEPETPEEEEMLAQANQQQGQPDPMMVAAQAEQAKADASMQKNQIAMTKVQMDGQIQQEQKQIDVFKAQTDRMAVQIQAEEAGAEIDYKRSKAFADRIVAESKVHSAYRAS
ncbi:MAG: hypothetical protein JKY50_22700 [Oleispira sp.]|nr:hypothetical protein [Oleispira sp.]